MTSKSERAVLCLRGHRQQDGLVALLMPPGQYIVDGKPLFIGRQYSSRPVIIDECDVLLGVSLVDAETGEQDPVHIKIEGEYVVNHRYIKAFRKMGHELSSSLYSYNSSIHACDVVHELLTKAGFRLLDQEPHTFSRPKDVNNTFYIKNQSLEFSKVFTVENDNYITFVIPELKQFEKSNCLRGNYSEMEAIYKKNDETIRSATGAWINRALNIRQLGDQTLQQLMANLNQAYALAGEVESKQKTDSKLRNLRTVLFDTIREVRAAASKANP